MRNIEWKRSLWICMKCGRFQYRNEKKCDGCNNIRGCITCEDGSEWAHYEVPELQFKVGDTIRSKVWESAVHEIVFMDDSAYFFENGGMVRFADQEQWELAEEPVSNDYSALLPCIYNRTLEERVKYCKYCSAACEGRVKEPVSEDLEEAAMQYAKSKHEDAVLQQIVSWDFKAGVQWQKEHLMDKACEWLEEHLLDFWSQKITNTDYFIEDFKQAMNK